MRNQHRSYFVEGEYLKVRELYLIAYLNDCIGSPITYEVIKNSVGKRDVWVVFPKDEALEALRGLENEDTAKGKRWAHVLGYISAAKYEINSVAKSL